MMRMPDTRRLGLVLGLAVVLVAATPQPNTGQNGYVTPTPAATRITMKPTPTPTATATPRPTPTATGKVTPTPTPTHEWTPTPPPGKDVLSDTIQFDGPHFCKLTSDGSDNDAPKAAGVRSEKAAAPAAPAPMNCRITAQHQGPASGTATIDVPGNPTETIVFQYSISGSTVTAGDVKEVEWRQSYPAYITGTMHGVPGTANFYGTIKVWELSTAP